MNREWVGFGSSQVEVDWIIFIQFGLASTLIRGEKHTYIQFDLGLSPENQETRVKLELDFEFCIRIMGRVSSFCYGFRPIARYETCPTSVV